MAHDDDRGKHPQSEDSGRGRLKHLGPYLTHIFGLINFLR
jgi:hypothetical protein